MRSQKIRKSAERTIIKTSSARADAAALFSSRAANLARPLAPRRERARLQSSVRSIGARVRALATCAIAAA